MGGLIPIGGGADAEIKASLNFAFNETNIQTVRSVWRSEKLFDDRKKHKIHRVAWRLRAYPVQHYSGTNSKGKWFYFLKHDLPDDAIDSIYAILTYAMKYAAVLRVVFDAVQNTAKKPPPHFVYPANPTKDSDIDMLVDSTGTLLITLVCPEPLDDKKIEKAPDAPGDADAGETQPPEIWPQFTYAVPSAYAALAFAVAPAVDAATYAPAVQPKKGGKKAKKAKKKAKKAKKQ